MLSSIIIQDYCWRRFALYERGASSLHIFFLLSKYYNVNNLFQLGVFFLIIYVKVSNAVASIF